MPALLKPRAESADSNQLLEFSGVFRSLEPTVETRRLSSGIAALDILLGGGIARGRVSEFIGRIGAGRTSLAASFAAAATRRGEVVGWIDAASAFDPSSMVAAGVDTACVLWVSVREATVARRLQNRSPFARRQSALLKAAELVLDAGGFGLIVIDFGDFRYPIPQSAALRLARAAERSGAAVIAIAQHRICGTFAVLSLVVNHTRALFNRLAVGAPAIFDGLRLEAAVARNKLGRSGGMTIVRTMTDPVGQLSLPYARATGDRKVAALKTVSGNRS
jgi:hypothetical protein